MRTLFTVLLMVGIAVGQDSFKTPFVIDEEAPLYLFRIMLNGKQMVGIFPDGQIEYGPNYKPDAAAKLFWESVGAARPKCFNPIAPKKPAGQKPDTNAVILRSEAASPAWLDCKSNRFRVNPDNQTLVCDEPVDVPAIQETRKHAWTAYERLVYNRQTMMAECLEDKSRFWEAHECFDEHWTCAEKSRILEHDESTPPKYWCRKVQQ